MPKHNTTPIQLPAEQPDCCATCPLVGIIPKANRPKGTKETHCCLGTTQARNGGYKILPIELLPEVWEKSCDLRFIRNWNLDKVYVKQFNQAVFEL